MGASWVSASATSARPPSNARHANFPRGRPAGAHGAISEPRRYFEGALLSDWPAFAFARILARHWRDDVEDFPPHLRAPLEDAREALERAAQRFDVERKAATARGIAEAVPAEAQASSNCRDTMTSAEVAILLGVSDRRVRQLAGMGTLPGRQEQGRWRFDRGPVLEYRARR